MDRNNILTGLVSHVVTTTEKIAWRNTLDSHSHIQKIMETISRIGGVKRVRHNKRRLINEGLKLYCDIVRENCGLTLQEQPVF